MTTKTNIDYRFKDMRDAREYFKNADIFVLAAKNGITTSFLVYTSEELDKLATDPKARACLRKSKGTLRWKGLMRDKLGRAGWKLGIHKAFDVNRKWNDFEVGSNGTMSEAQEKTVCEELNKRYLLGKEWRWCANEHWEDGYTPDIVSTDGTIKVEVKGFGGMFHK